MEADYADKLFANMAKFGIDPDSDRKDQHFIICKDIVDVLVNAAQISGGDYVLEIGPGIGQISEAILEKGARLVSVEIDSRFRGILADIQSRHSDRFEVIWGSALEVDWPRGINKIVMNPPFSILEPMLEALYSQREIELISMIIGKRYQENAIQRPGGRGFNKSALMTQAKFSPAFVTEIKKECFYPQAGEKAVVMTLSLNKKICPVMKKLADFYVEFPEVNVKFIVNQALELLNRNARKYKKIENMITMKQLGFEDTLLNKRLQDLNNSELSKIVQRLTSLFNFQRKKTTRFRR